MKTALKTWWYLVLRGACSLLFGVAALCFPWQLFTALVLLFGAYALVDGLLAVLWALKVNRGQRVGVLFIEGMLGVLVGMATLLWPHLTAHVLLYLIALWAIVTGILEIAAMAWLRRIGLSSFLLALSGVFSVVLGVALFFVPQAGMVALTWLLGGYAVVFGALLVGFGLKLRSLYLIRSHNGHEHELVRPSHIQPTDSDSRVPA